jgi:hypothetical protein
MVDLIRFIKEGDVNSTIFLGMNLEEAIRLQGNDFERIGNMQSGYIKDAELRLGYFENKVDEIAIMYFDTNIEHLVDGEYGSVSVSKKTQIHEFIQILNYNEISWKSYKETDLDYFYLIAQSGVTGIFELDSGTLNRISFTG